jgi:alpha 1,6-mannosyltransferase
LLLLEGGIYTDTDTSLLKSPTHWGSHAKLFRDGAGWVHEVDLKRISGGEDMNKVLGEPSVVVGIEADVGDRDDWFDWWPRPVSLNILAFAWYTPLHCHGG